MIWDYFRTDDPVTRKDLERIGELIYGDIFLKGLGTRSSEMLAPPDFPIITDIVRADELMAPKVLWDLPEPLPYHELHGVIEEELGHLEFETGNPNQWRLDLNREMSEHSLRFDTHLLDVIQLTYRTYGICGYIRSFVAEQELREDAFKHTVIDVFQNNILGDIMDLITAAYFGGLENSPIFNRLLEAFETGGMPCGWLGPLPEDGGDPVKAIALLHFGRRGK